MGSFYSVLCPGMIPGGLSGNESFTQSYKKANLQRQNSLQKKQQSQQHWWQKATHRRVGKRTSYSSSEDEDDEEEECQMVRTGEPTEAAHEDVTWNEAYQEEGFELGNVDENVFYEQLREIEDLFSIDREEKGIATPEIQKKRVSCKQKSKKDNQDLAIVAEVSDKESTAEDEVLYREDSPTESDECRQETLERIMEEKESIEDITEKNREEVQSVDIKNGDDGVVQSPPSCTDETDNTVPKDVSVDDLDKLDELVEENKQRSAQQDKTSETGGICISKGERQHSTTSERRDSSEDRRCSSSERRRSSDGEGSHHRIKKSIKVQESGHRSRRRKSSDASDKSKSHNKTLVSQTSIKSPLEKNYILKWQEVSRRAKKMEQVSPSCKIMHILSLRHKHK